MNSENFICFVKTFNQFEWAKENHPEATLSAYGYDKELSKKLNEADGGKALKFRGNIRNGIEKAKIFEIEDDIKKLLCLTETPIKNDEIKLPFEVVFIDVKFTKEELSELGIEINADEIIGIIGREGVLQSSDGIKVGKDLNICMLSRKDGEDWFEDFNKNCNLEEQYQDFNLKIVEISTTDKKARDFVHKFFLNFLNFMNNPEVEYVEHTRSAKSRERRAKKGLPVIPSSMSIRVTGKLKEYIDEASSGANWTYNYRFWVRGHFRDLVSERYLEKKRIWILPYIKGKGVLIDKTYTITKGVEQDGN